MKTNKLPILLRITLSIIGCVTALVFPFILYYIGGTKNSLSLYVTDKSTIDIFNYSLIIISISLMIRKVYLFSSFLILMIVYFDVANYPNLHDLIAGTLFLLLTAVLVIEKKYLYSSIMLINLFILNIYGLYFFELIAILVIVLYNLEITLKVIQKEYLE